MKRLMRRTLRLVVTVAALATAASSLGCGAKVYEREFLADPVMSFDVDADEERRELKWLEAREGSAGGAGGAGGGCACN